MPNSLNPLTAAENKDLKHHHCGSSDKEPANAGGIRDLGLIPGSGRSPEARNGNPFSCILAWRLPWTEDPGGLQSIESQRVGHDCSDLAHTQASS